MASSKALAMINEAFIRLAQPVYLSKASSRFGLPIVLCFFLIITVAHLFGTKTVQPVHGNLNLQRNKLHLLLPASKPNINLLKAFISAVILGYPPPIIVNWSAESNATNNEDVNSSTRFASQMEFLFSVSQYLENIRDAHKNDLVLVTDSLDTCFQLPATILLSRYFAINRQANDMIKTRLGTATAANFTQSIIFGAEKKCWPHRADEVGCWSIPESPLPKALYGPLTDQKVKGADEFQFMRPRYLNAGFTIGPVKDMQALFRYAAHLARKNPNILGADQGIHARILGEQEYMREVARANRANHIRPNLKRESMLDFKVDTRKRYEFAVGLDYERSLGWPTAHSEEDAKWVRFSDKKSIEKMVKSSRYKVTEARILDGLEEDLRLSSSPLEHLNMRNQWPLEAKNKSWADLPLFADLWTGIVPATIHFNAKDKKGKKKLRDEAWRKMWFAPYVRDLFNATIAQFEGGTQKEHLVAKLHGQEFYGLMSKESLRQRGFCAEAIDKRGNRTWVKWEDLSDDKSWIRSIHLEN